MRRRTRNDVQRLGKTNDTYVVNSSYSTNKIFFYFFLFKLEIFRTYGKTQTNLQEEVKSTHRPFLRVCK